MVIHQAERHVFWDPLAHLYNCLQSKHGGAEIETETETETGKLPRVTHGAQQFTSPTLPLSLPLTPACDQHLHCPVHALLLTARSRLCVPVPHIPHNELQAEGGGQARVRAGVVLSLTSEPNEGSVGTTYNLSHRLECAALDLGDQTPHNPH